jgi:hypothetical protein
MHSKDQAMVNVPHRRDAGHDVLELQEAERELSSFHRAVSQMCGPEEAQKTSECWIEELETATCLEKPMPWRRISINAAAKMASRLVVQPTRECVRCAAIRDAGNAVKTLCHAFAYV